MRCALIFLIGLMLIHYCYRDLINAEYEKNPNKIYIYIAIILVVFYLFCTERRMIEGLEQVSTKSILSDIATPTEKPLAHGKLPQVRSMVGDLLGEAECEIRGSMLKLMQRDGASDNLLEQVYLRHYMPNCSQNN